MLRWGLSSVRALGGLDSILRQSFSLHSGIRTLQNQDANGQQQCADADTQAQHVIEPLDAPMVSAVTASSRDPVAVDFANVSGVPVTHIFEWERTAKIAPVLDPASTSSTQMDTAAVDTLWSFLSQDNVNSDSPRVYSPNIVRSLYHSAESRNQLGKLNSGMLSTLIGLFGSLSIDPPRSLVHRVPLASHLASLSKTRTYWSFVSKVAKFKQRSGMTLSDSDRFWLLRAELAAVRILVSGARPKGLSDDVLRAISRARVHYRCIRRRSYYPEVHVAYLETLVDSRGVEFAAADIAFTLRTHQICHPRLLAVLYRLVIQFGSELSARAQARILSAIWTRIHLGGHVFEYGNNEPSPPSQGSWDATMFAHCLSTALLASSKLAMSRLCSYKLQQQLPTVFSPSRPLAERWTALTLVALLNAPEAVTNGSSIRYDSFDCKRSSTASLWEVIFGLATLEKVFMGSSILLGERPMAVNGILDTARALFQTWCQVVGSHLVSIEVARGISASFFRVAGRGGDASLMDACRSLCDSRGIWPQDPNTDLNGDFMVAQYLAALVRVHGVRSHLVFRTVNAVSSNNKIQCKVFSVAVEELAITDPKLACAFHATTTQSGKQAASIASNVTHSLVLSLLRRGYLEDAVQLLTQNRFTEKQLEVLLASMARHIRRDKLRYRSDVTITILHQLLSFYKSHAPSEGFRRQFEHLLLILCQHGKGRQILYVVSSVVQKSPTYFSPRFFYSLCTVLLRHRQFNGAGKVAAIIAVSHPVTSLRLHLLVTSAALRARISRAGKRVRIPLIPSDGRYHGRNLHSTSPQKPHNRSMSLKLLPYARGSRHEGPALEQVMQDLVSLGRIFAARRLFARFGPTIAPKRHTALGNILLHGVSRQPRPRNGRLVRKLLALLERLVKQHAFRPDRVTVNILLKAMINWRSTFDDVRLRALFDQLVRSGYPAADHSPQRPPFGTPPTSSSGSVLALSKVTSSISFERHARPLYKMFIKAFYLRHDIGAARRIVRILKVEDRKNAVLREKRSRARSKGRTKAGWVNGRLGIVHHGILR